MGISPIYRDAMYRTRSAGQAWIYRDILESLSTLLWVGMNLGSEFITIMSESRDD